MRYKPVTTFDFNQPQKPNLLILGDSYSDAINEVIASHYNKTFDYDLRKLDGKFDFTQFCAQNNISDVLILCATDFPSGIALSGWWSTI
jgi:hypothetical protein